jgi:tetratricopeptide (TPR) repeat protein
VSTRGGLLYFAGRYGEAVAECRRALALSPGSPSPHNWMFRIFLLQGRYEEAIASTVAADTHFAGMSADSEARYSGEAFAAYHAGGVPALAGHFLNPLSGPQAPIRRYDRAVWRIISGDRDGAIEELRQGFEVRPYHMMFLKVDPIFRPLANDPRFVQLIRAAGL